MDVISNTGASSDEGDIVVCKRNQLSRRQLSDSDDDGYLGVSSRFQSPTLESNINRREYSDSSDGESKTILKVHKKKKSRIISKKLDSDDEELSGSCRQLSSSENDDRNSKRRNSPLSKSQSQKEQTELHTDSESDSSTKSQVKKTNSKSIIASIDSHGLDESETVSKWSPPVKNTPVSSDESESNSVSQAKQKRVHRKDKMLHKIRKTFDRNKSPNRPDRSSIMLPLSSICDNDSSSDEGRTMASESIDDIKHFYDKENKKNKSGYRCKNNKPEKPVRMSAKEAMENMTKIKSESCRMLREKRVSLPYHRPKQLSLKDILNRKRPELPPDKKPLSFKMNQDQLEQFAKQLEESQKHLSELYKSDDEDDENMDENTENQDKISLNEIIDDATNDKKGGTANATKSISNGEIVDQLFDSTLAEFEKTLNGDCDDETQKIYCNDEAPRSEYNDGTQKTDCNLGSENVSGVDGQNVNSTSKSAMSDTETESSITSKAPGHLIEKKIENMGSKTDPQQPQIGSQLISLQYTDNTEMECKPGVSNQKAEYGILEDTEKNIGLDLLSKCESQKNNLSNDKPEQSENGTDPSTHGKLVLRLNNSETNISEDNEKYLHEKNGTSGEKCVQVEQNVDEPEHTQDLSDDFPEDDFEDIMVQIERDVAMEDSPMLVQEQSIANSKPHLHGTPGSLIELDDGAPHKLSGVEILKQRYLFFSNMKTSEEVEREKEKRIKPGDQRKLLKRELVKQIQEQSVAEWTKRLQEEQLLGRETHEMSEDVSEGEDELEKLEKQCEDEENTENSPAAVDEIKDEGDNGENGIGDEQEEDENDEEEEQIVGKGKIEMKRQNKVKLGGLIDDEAEVSEDEADENENENEDEENEYEESSSDDTSSDEEEIQSKKPKKGRIIKAFEDSDDETEEKVKQTSIEKEQEKQEENTVEIGNMKAACPDDTPDLFESQTTDGDVDIPLAQQAVNSEEMNISFVEEQATEKVPSEPEPTAVRFDVAFDVPNTQVDLSEVVGFCSGIFPGASQSAVAPHPTQVIGEDILQLCSGRFDLGGTQTITRDHATDLEATQTQTRDSQIKTLLAELDGNGPLVKSNKFFETAVQKDSNGDVKENNKGKLVIESSDEEGDEVQKKKKNKLKRRKKLEKRTLQISDDEEEDLDEQSDYESEPEEIDDDGERVVDYDSEENEVEVQPLLTKKTKKLASEFMEKEAELTSEDEWAGSGDEDERGLDTMEREEGDDDVFHQGKLRRELEIMHMQDLMDQDRQEVRMLQEILLEDDLEGGSRQRRFRWNNNAEGEDERGSATDELGEEGREEREAELWRQQRHKRELFLRQLAEKEKSDDDILGLGTPDFLSSCVLPKKNAAAVPEDDGNTKPGEKKPKDVPSPVKNSFTIMQQQYLALKRGSSTAAGLGVRQALQRLAASVEPPTERQASAGTSKGSFVFATLTQPQKNDELDEPAPVQKKNKRKAQECGTPKLIKKLRVEEKPRTSLLQHLTD